MNNVIKSKKKKKRTKESTEVCLRQEKEISKKLKQKKKKRERERHNHSRVDRVERQWEQVRARVEKKEEVARAVEISIFRVCIDPATMEWRARVPRNCSCLRSFVVRRLISPFLRFLPDFPCKPASARRPSNYEELPRRLQR